MPLRLAAGAIVLALLLGLQFVISQYINDYVQQVILLAGINIILAVSLNLINGITGQFSLGHIGFMAIGAYTGGFVTVLGEQRLALPQGVIFALALFAGAAMAGLAGYLVGLPSLRLRGDYLAIVTLGFGEIIRVLITNIERVQLPVYGWLPASAQSGVQSLNAILGTVDMGGSSGFHDIPLRTTFAWVFAGAVGCILMVSNLASSNLGRAMRAVREDEIAAEAAGINTTQVKVLAFVVSAMWAGVAGVLQAHLLQGADPTSYKFDQSVIVVVMVVLGGLGSITGAAIVAVLLKVLEEVLRTVSGAFFVGLVLTAFAGFWSLPRHRAAMQRDQVRGMVGWLTGPLLCVAGLFYLFLGQRAWLESIVAPLRFIIYGLILVVLMLLRPQGILGRAELGRHLLRRRRAASQNVK